MPFRDCACHVFAIDGYKNDNGMLATNNVYMNLFSPQQVVAGRGGNWNAKSQLEYIVAAVRAITKPQMTRTVIKIYGGFRAGQLQPEHMWIEHDSWIYDTMPAWELQGVPASDERRARPYLEGLTFAGNGCDAPFCLTTATQDQLDNLTTVERHPV